MAEKISGYANTASSFNDASFWEISKSLGGGLFQSQKVPHSLLRAFVLSENIQQISYANLVILSGAAGMTVLKTYYIDDAVAGDKLLRVIAATTSALYQSAFDLTTGQTGIYDLSTDKFFPLIQSFKRTANQAQIYAGADLAITQCPALPAGYAWEVVTANARLVGATTPYDGTPDIHIKASGASRPMYYDQTIVLSSGVALWLSLEPYNTLTGPNTNLKESDGLVLSFNSATSTAGDGTLTIYGTARIIEL